MKRTASEKKKSKSNFPYTIDVSTLAKTRFAICINNKGYPASLEKGNLYRVVPDRSAAARGFLRVIDESGEDYGYSAARFLPVRIPRVLQRFLSSMGANTFSK